MKHSGSRIYRILSKGDNIIAAKRLGRLRKWTQQQDRERLKLFRSKISLFVKLRWI